MPARSAASMTASILHMSKLGGIVPVCDALPEEYVNDPFVIAQHKRMVAINSAIEVDVPGQVCTDGVGPSMAGLI